MTTNFACVAAHRVLNSEQRSEVTVNVKIVVARTDAAIDILWVREESRLAEFPSGLRVADPTSRGVAGSAALDAAGAAAAGEALLSALVVMLMTPPRTHREWAVG